MWKRFWQTWTIDKPAAFGDLLWEVCVVQFAAFLDRLSVRQVIAFIPVVILALAWSHSIPLPPELMLLGDLLAYIDIFSALFLLGVLSRVTTVIFIVKQAAGYLARTAMIVRDGLRRLGRRETETKTRTRPSRWAETDDDDPSIIDGVAWA